MVDRPVRRVGFCKTQILGRDIVLRISSCKGESISSLFRILRKTKVEGGTIRFATLNWYLPKPTYLGRTGQCWSKLILDAKAWIVNIIIDTRRFKILIFKAEVSKDRGPRVKTVRVTRSHRINELIRRTLISVISKIII